MKLAIMQPYFLPYIGYWQLLNAVDKFIIYDNIQYTKRGWINRNRFLQNGKDVIFSVPLKKASSALNINDRVIAPTYDKKKLINQLSNAYNKAPNFNGVHPVIKNAIDYETENLFHYLLASIKQICSYLGIDTSKIVISSTIPVDHSLKSEDKVIALCQYIGADEYYNPIGGTALYDKANFTKKGINLSFLKSLPIEYNQFNNTFSPWLSIIDVMMFNDTNTIRYMLEKYDLE